MKLKFKITSLVLAVSLATEMFAPAVLFARPSNMKAPTIQVPDFTIEVPTDMPSAFENLSDKYQGSLGELAEQGWGENNYENGLFNQLQPPPGFGQVTGEDVFYATYGTEVMDENWQDFGSSLYREDKFNAQKNTVANSYVDYYTGNQYQFKDSVSDIDAEHPETGDAKITFGDKSKFERYENGTVKPNSYKGKEYQDIIEDMSTLASAKGDSGENYEREKYTNTGMVIGAGTAVAAIGIATAFGAKLGVLGGPIGIAIGAGLGAIGGTIWYFATKNKNNTSTANPVTTNGVTNPNAGSFVGGNNSLSDLSTPESCFK